MFDQPEVADRVPVLRNLGIKLLESGDNHAVMTMTVGEEHANYMRGAHGGIIATLADTVSFFARPLLPSGRRLTTTGLTISYVRPAAVGEVLTARSELLHLGSRTVSVAFRITRGDGKLVAHGTTALMFIED